MSSSGNEISEESPEAAPPEAGKPVRRRGAWAPDQQGSRGRGGLLPHGGPLRALLKRIYYSWPMRTLVYGPLDLLDRLRGRRDPLTPPRRLQYVGEGAGFERIGSFWRERLVHDHGLTPDSDVLDIGCGIGRVAVALIPRLETGSYEGFDVVPAAVDWCRREVTSRHPSFRFQLADVRNRQYNPKGGVPAEHYEFPYEDASFDLVLAASVFTHMRPDGTQRYLAEAARVLRPGGRFVCTFFLVDEVAERRRRSGELAFSLDSELTDPSGIGFFASDARIPEFNVGLRERDAGEMFEKAGLVRTGPVDRGRWSGRPLRRPTPYQDIVVLRHR